MGRRKFASAACATARAAAWSANSNMGENSEQASKRQPASSAAMKDSAQACLDNIGAVALYLVVLVGAVMALSMLLSLIPVLGQLLLMTALIPVVSVAGFVAWRQVYRQAITQELPPANPPPPPSVEA